MQSRSRTRIIDCDGLLYLITLEEFHGPGITPVFSPPSPLPTNFLPAARPTSGPARLESTNEIGSVRTIAPGDSRMSDRPPCVRTPGPRRILAGPLALFLALTLTASGCSPGSDPSQAGAGTTSKVPEIANRQKHMEEMLKKGESKAKSPTKPH